LSPRKSGKKAGKKAKPTSLAVGANPHAQALLGSAIDAGRFHRSLLFHGPLGSGRTATARWLAARLQCEKAGRGDVPCGRCVPCGKVERGVHPDVHTAAPEGNEIKVDAIRDLCRAASFRPYEGRHTVLIVPRAERLNVHAADAMLKTLEEPPPSLVWVLAAPSPESVQPTIASRCQAIRFPPLPPEELAGYLRRERDGLSEEEAALLVRLTRGDVERALVEDPAVLGKERDAALKLLAGIARGEAGERAFVEFVDARHRAPKKDEDGRPTSPDRLRGALELLLGIFREALAAATGSEARPELPAGEGKAVDDLAGRLGPEGAARGVLRVERALRALDAHANRRLLGETLLLDLQEILRAAAAGS
jgi:DNA polymerase-3 subunit delta'